MNHYIIQKTPTNYLVSGILPTTRQIAGRIIAVDAPSVQGNARVITSEVTPTQEQMIAAFGDDPLSLAKKSKEEEIFKASYAALSTIFSSLPAGPQAQFKPVEDAIVAAAKSGNWILAANILSTAVVPTELVAMQTAMVAAFAPYLVNLSALLSATTLEAVNTIVVL